jgi:hypothetical protein
MIENWLLRLEARAGIEPTYEDLQSSYNRVPVHKSVCSNKRSPTDSENRRLLQHVERKIQPEPSNR